MIGGAAGYSTLHFGDAAAYNVGGVIYNHSTNTMTLDAGGNTGIAIDSSGRVGIGITAPDSHVNLHIQDSAYAFLALEATASGGRQYELFSYAADESFHIYDRNADAYRLSIDETGKVGIGTTSPSGMLHIQEGSNYGAVDSGADQLVVSNDGSESGITIAATTVATINFADAAGSRIGRVRYEHDNNKMEFWANDAERMSIASDGKVGIRTTSPQSDFVVAASDAGKGLELQVTTNATTPQYVMAYDRANSAYLNLAMAGADITLDAVGDIVFDAGGQNWYFDDDGTRVFSIAQVSSDVYIGAEVSDKDIFFRVNDGGTVITAMTIDSSVGGMIGIGTTTPSAPLDVVENSAAWVGEFTQTNTDNGDGLLVQVGSTAAADYALSIRSNACLLYTSPSPRD